MRCSSVLVALLLIWIYPSCSEALSVSGVPEWLEGAVARSLRAVWLEIPNTPEIDREGTLELVAGSLFAGYNVKVIPGRSEPAIILSSREELISPDVKIVLPELRGIALKWFSGDVAGMENEVARLTCTLPQSAYTWADEALREQLARIVNRQLPGWEFAEQIYILPGKTLITLSFRPSSKMVLAVKPSLSSHTIPAMFRSDLEARLIPELSPLIGLPVKWVELHHADIEVAARKFLKERHAVENLRANINISFHAGSVSLLDVRADSEDFMFDVWVAAYAGMENRYPEAGVFFGFRPKTSFSPEFYAEAVLSLNDFNVESRLGLRFEVADKWYAGAGYQWPNEVYFLSLQYAPLKVRRPYVMWRWLPEIGAHEGAIGYCIDEHVSLELYYDGTCDDKVGIRWTWHL